MKTHKPFFKNRERRTHKLRYESGRFKELYGSTSWKKIRDIHLSKYPFCNECGSKENLEVDHRIAHNGNWDLFINPNNLDTKCKSCHSKKTVDKDQSRGSDGRFKRKEKKDD